MRTVLLAAAAVLALSCGGGGKTMRAGAPDATPSWLSEGTGAIRTEGGRKLQGVGVASGATNERARRHQADGAAREQLQGAVDALVRVLARTGESPQDGQAVAAMARRAAAQVSAIRDHWVTPDGDERALAVVEVDEFKKALQGVDGDDRVRREMFANVDRAFEQIAIARGR
ncbi:MAG: hypothetical protein AUG04_03865 [Deltaproteobacteria bacterium 13_1_20CM_2_69_21]|nr:MAG: hypothetical protein AUH38_04145 [Deltaproteobacteria bacterium 13_1_40CM_68_24]OLC77523.1 MAG: hypothetical protein AUH83_04485 [Deltaproteobacteria bacterium 13_1_40CM_4_68_19]OLD47652.1 MAG: hypothetical protein AUI48_02915 [Chloroflexi bacterium 13_1_40CM_2_68_14]OLE63718.1 MAG: hypothetical protein AUG04_03865 [Deltaproteobacteria bacterium 13_1_20CM_2_69_21]